MRRPSSSASVALCLSLAVLLVCVSGGRAQAQSNEKQAETLNTEGKKLIKELDLEGAAERFRRAMELSEDPRYAFNLCYTLEKSGKLQEARDACLHVVASGDQRLGAKASGLLDSIDAKLAEQGTPVPDRPAQNPDSAQPPDTQPPVNSGPAPTPPPLPKETPGPKVPYLGFMAGLSQANVASDGDTDAVVGLALGGAILLRSGPGLNVVADAQIVQRGFALRAVGLPPASLRMTYFDIGAAARYLLGRGGLTPYIEVGTTFSIKLTSGAQIDGVELDPSEVEEPNPVDIATTLGAGLRIGMVDLRARYMIGLLNINSENRDLGPTVETKHRVLVIQGGYWF